MCCPFLHAVTFCFHCVVLVRCFFPVIFVVLSLLGCFSRIFHCFSVEKSRLEAERGRQQPPGGASERGHRASDEGFAPPDHAPRRRGEVNLFVDAFFVDQKHGKYEIVGTPSYQYGGYGAGQKYLLTMTGEHIVRAGPGKRGTGF